MTESHIKKAFGARVRRFRRQRDLTQEALADRVNMSVHSISSIERGVNATRLETAGLIAEALGVHVGELFRDEGADGPAYPDDIAEFASVLAAQHPETRKKLRSIIALALDLSAKGFEG